MRGAIILAGGAGRRFRSAGGAVDKALFMVEGKPMLVRVAESVKEVVDEVVVAVDSETKAKNYAELVDWIDVVVDEGGPRGPLRGIRTGLRKLTADSCLVVPCDSPFLKPLVLDKLLRKVEEGFEGVLPLWPNGKHEPLLAAYRREEALKLSEALARVDRSRTDDLIRAGLTTFFLSVPLEVKPLDPELKSFININRPSDLHAPPPWVEEEKESFAIKPQLSSSEVVRIVSKAVDAGLPTIADEAGNLFWSALTRVYVARLREDQKMLVEASNLFKKEGEEYLRRGLKLFYARALVDASACLRKVDDDKAEELLNEALKVYRELKVASKAA
ncbi:MAG: hypothetical protein DRJ98_00015 [Thermoprotei archaeon]|nr:MAG: hypothetical protein DRJ98_00015 [Thermoprotei archaeon]RLF18446.1 MAG: hypothetical protein DRN06_01475 [Thermoprotei archaeon]